MKMGREGGSDDVCYKPVANSGACELSYPDGITHECRKRFITVVTSSETPTGDVLDLSDPFVSWCPHDDDAERVILALREIPVHGGPQNRWGHSAVAAVRNLLRFAATAMIATLDIHRAMLASPIALRSRGPGCPCSLGCLGRPG